MHQNILIYLRKTVYIFSAFYIFMFLNYYIMLIIVTFASPILRECYNVLVVYAVFILFTSTLREIPIIKQIKKNIG